MICRGDGMKRDNLILERDDLIGQNDNYNLDWRLVTKSLYEAAVCSFISLSFILFVVRAGAVLW